MGDHYFETRMTGPDGADIPPARFPTPQGAMSHILRLGKGVHGSIWHHGEPESAPVETFRYYADGTLVDALNDDGSNCPLNWVPDIIEPGPMMFSLWLDGADSERLPYDFGFCWDGEHAADLQCERGDNKTPESPSCKGTITWSNRYDFFEDVEDEDVDDLEGDLHVTYTSSSPSGEISGQAVIQAAAVKDPIHRNGWVEAAKVLFAFLNDQKLI